MAVKFNKPVQLMDLGTYSIKYGVFKMDKETNELEAVSREVYRVPTSFSGVDVYVEQFGQYIKDIADKLDKKLPVRFTLSTLFAPTNLAYLTRIDKEQVQTRIKEELEKFANQEKIPPENEHNKFYELFSKDMDTKSQVIAATILMNPKYVGMIKNHLYANGLKFGGIYPVMQTSIAMYDKIVELNAEMKEEPIVFVDIGQMTTKVNLFFQGDLLFNKVLHYGAKSFYDELFDFSNKSGESSLSPSEVEEVLQKVGFTGERDLVNQMGYDINDPTPYLQNLDATLKSIFTKINSSINYFTSALARNFTKDNAAFMSIRKGAAHIFFTGGITNAPDFFKRAEETFNKSKLYAIDPFNIKETLEQTPEKFEDDEFRMNLRQTSAFADISATSLVALDNKKDTLLNLVSKVDSENENIIQLLRKTPLTRWRDILAVTLVVLLANSGWNYFTISSTREGLSKKVRKLKSATNGAEAARQRMLELKKQDTLFKAQLGYTTEVMKNYAYWPRVLKQLMTKIGPEIKLTELVFSAEQPTFNSGNYRKWVEEQNDKFNPWTNMIVAFKLSGDALQRADINKLINTLIETGVYLIPKPPSPQYVQEQVKKIPSGTKGEMTEVTISAHYKFTMEGFLKLDNPL